MTNRADTFNRADSSSTINSPSDGLGDWTPVTATFGISSNQGYGSSNPINDAIIYLSSGTTNVRVAITAVSYGIVDTKAIAPIARVTDGSNYLLYFPATSSGGLYKRDTGSYSLLSGFSTTPVAGDIFELEVDAANLLTAYQNSVSKGSVTSSFNSSRTNHGVWLSGNNNANQQRFDAFSSTDLAAAVGGFFARYNYEMLTRNQQPA